MKKSLRKAILEMPKEKMDKILKRENIDDHRDKLARKDKSRPFAFYADEFYALARLRQDIGNLEVRHRKEGGKHFKKAARLIEMAENEMLKAGR